MVAVLSVTAHRLLATLSLRSACGLVARPIGSDNECVWILMLVHCCKVKPIEDALEYMEGIMATCNQILAASEAHQLVAVEIPNMSKVTGHIASDVGPRFLKQATQSLWHSADATCRTLQMLLPHPDSDLVAHRSQRAIVLVASMAPQVLERIAVCKKDMALVSTLLSQINSRMQRS